MLKNPVHCSKYLFFVFSASLILSLNWSWAEQVPQVDWLSAPRNATVALGQIKEAFVRVPEGKAQRKRIFGIVGTGVLVGMPDDPSKIPYLVTARHNFYDPDRTPLWDPDSIQVRFSWFDSRPVDEYLGITIKLKNTNRRLWTAHLDPAVDLAAIPLRIPISEAGKESAEIIPLQNFATADDVYESAPVLVLGYPGAVGPAFWSRSLARSGIIAWVHPTSPLSSPLLVDAMVFPGNSGGPVFKLATGTDRFGRFTIGTGVKFLGIITEGRFQEMPLKTMGKSIEIQGPTGPIKLVSEQWIGIGVVEPASRVRDLLQAIRASTIPSHDRQQ